MRIFETLFLTILCFHIGSNGLSQTPYDNYRQDTNWAEWRGNEINGLTMSISLPTEWSENKNIKWKVPIPGSGYSSPIILDGNIYLTTSFLSQKSNKLNRLFSRSVILLNILILFWLTFLVRGKVAMIQRRREWTSLLLFVITILIIILLGFFSDNLFDYNRCNSRRWVGSSVSLVLSIFSLSFFIQEKSRFLQK